MNSSTETPYQLFGELELLKLCEQGKSAAFDELENRYRLRLYQTALAMLNSPQAAEKAVEHMFRTSREEMHEFKRDSLFLTWICRRLMKHILHTSAAATNGEQTADQKNV